MVVDCFPNYFLCTLISWAEREYTGVAIKATSRLNESEDTSRSRYGDAHHHQPDHQGPLTPPSNPIHPGTKHHKHLASAWPGCLIMSPFVLLTHVCSRPEHIPPPPSLSTHVGTAHISTQTAVQPTDIHLSQKGLSHTELTLSCTAQQRWDDTNKLLPWEWVVASHWGQWNKRLIKAIRQLLNLFNLI